MATSGKVRVIIDPAFAYKPFHKSDYENTFILVSVVSFKSIIYDKV